MVSTLIAVVVGTYMAERDTGEMFIHFILSEYVKPFYVVDVSNVSTEEGWERGSLGGW